MHQLPAHAAAPEGVVRDVPQGRLRDHRRAHARVRVRARRLERARAPSSDSASRIRSSRTTTTRPGTRYANQYWPAEYLIDKTGHIRHTHFGEGEYDKTESLIRQLLGAKGAKARQVADATPTGLLTPETYLGYARLAELRRHDGLAGRRRELPPAGQRAAEHVRLRRPVARRRRSRSSPARARPCGSTSTRRTCTSSSAARARSSALIDGKPTRTLHVERAAPLHRARVDARPPTQRWSSASPRASRATPSRSARQRPRGPRQVAATVAKVPRIVTRVEIFEGATGRGRRRRRRCRFLALAGSASARRRSIRPTGGSPRRRARRRGARAPRRTTTSPRRRRPPRSPAASTHSAASSSSAVSTSASSSSARRSTSAFAARGDGVSET